VKYKSKKERKVKWPITRMRGQDGAERGWQCCRKIIQGEDTPNITIVVTYRIPDASRQLSQPQIAHHKPFFLLPFTFMFPAAAASGTVMIVMIVMTMMEH
jgi:hypothetical protein